MSNKAFQFYPLQRPYTQKDLISGVVYKFHCGLCNESYYGESIRHLDIRSGEHIGVSPLTGKKVKPINNSSVRDHLLHCNYLPSFNIVCITKHPLNLQTVQAPLFRQSPLYIGFSWTPPLKIVFFSEPQKYWSLSFLTLFYLLNVTKFLVKTFQFEFLFMTEKHFCL